MPLINSETVKCYPSLRDFGLTLRPSKVGPEIELVNSFIDANLPAPPKGQELTVFVEPQIESGFPDIVAAYWHVRTASAWSSNRSNLTRLDIRLLHYLAVYGPAEISHLKPLFSSRASSAMERLYQAELVRPVRGEWRARPLENIFAIRRLVAIEAKISEWRQGLHQALMNTWFSSESYLLLPRLPKKPILIEQAARHGVGVVTGDQPLSAARAAARQERLPKSYASWLFNEWTWQTACHL